jgi:hypothetical protein
MEIYPVEAELLHADVQKDRHAKLIVAFRNFVNAPESDPVGFCEEDDEPISVQGCW